MSNIMILVARELELERIRAPFADSIMVEALRRTALRQFYRLAAPQIIEAGSREWGIDPYEVDWISVFTPIELALWHDIRAADLVMYPQFPIGGYITKSAAKVCIECDGSQWHQDAEKDAIRQQRIEGCGWTMYRISGRDCKTDSHPETGDAGAARTFINHIAAHHAVSRRQ